MAGMAAIAIGAPADAAQIVLNPVADTTLISDDPNYAIGAGPLFFGTTANGFRRALLRFDLSALPAGAQIDAATVKVIVDRAGPGSGAQAASLHRASASWGEGTSFSSGGGGAQATLEDATWDYRFYGNPPAIPRPPWLAPGGDYIAAPSSTVTLGANGPVTWASSAGLVADVQFWAANPGANFGWFLIGPENDAVPRTVRRASSREDAVLANRPVLFIDYTPATPAPVQQVPLPPWSYAVLCVLLFSVGSRYSGTGGRRQPAHPQHG